MGLFYFWQVSSQESELAHFLVARKKCEELRKEIEETAKTPEIPDITVPSEILSKVIDEKPIENFVEKSVEIIENKIPVAAKRSSISRQENVTQDPRYQYSFFSLIGLNVRPNAHPDLNLI